jgi:hypothetical protein
MLKHGSGASTVGYRDDHADGVLANANEWSRIAAFAAANVEWLKSFLKLPKGISSPDTIQRLMSMIDGKRSRGLGYRQWW